MTIKQKAQQLINSLPEELTTEELEAALEQLVERLKIEEGLEDSRAGRTVSHEEVTQRMSRWLSK